MSSRSLSRRAVLAAPVVVATAVAVAPGTASAKEAQPAAEERIIECAADLIGGK
ncbi:hypothetical protein [Stackebrandtia soli]|uniref:hypothetical protein n=1 Tax=Stackebrandtia soli TaxID=1892856 RepID=UPI0039ECBA34